MVDFPDWQIFEMLFGSWTGSVTGVAGEGRGTRSYELIMDGRFLLVRDRTEFSAQERNPEGEVHQDWGLISYDEHRELYVLRQFLIEGYVNQYTLTSPSAQNQLMFVTESIENLPEGWRARETLSFTDEDHFAEEFDLAEPGQDFQPTIQVFWERSS